MNLTMVPVTADNREEISRLHVAAGQESYIETVPQCLREAEEEARWRPFGIFDGKQAVGFAMLGFFEKEYPVAFSPKAGSMPVTFQPQPGRLWLDRFLIDGAAQGAGLGQAALSLIAKTLSLEFPDREIYLSVYPENSAAIHLYRSFGFQFTGEKDIHGEDIMVCYPPFPG